MEVLELEQLCRDLIFVNKHFGKFLNFHFMVRKIGIFITLFQKNSLSNLANHGSFSTCERDLYMDLIY